MQELPNEIWQEVFELACVDHGFTARSLSAVSRRFYLLAIPYKYRSVCLTSGRAILKFASLIQTQSEQPFRIHHLFLAATAITPVEGATPPLLTAPSNIQSQSTTSENAPLEERFMWTWASMGEQQIAIFDAVNVVLKTCASTLTTLALWSEPVNSDFVHPFLLSTLPLPKLRELTWKVGDTDDTLLPPMPRPPFISSSRPILYPSLENLHIDARGTVSALRYIRDVCPSLTHLRMHICGGSFWNIGGRHSDPPYIRNMPKKLVMNYLDLILSATESLDSLAFYLQLISGRLNLFGLLAKHATLVYPRDTSVNGVKADWMDRLAGGPGEWQGNQIEMPRT